MDGQHESSLHAKEKVRGWAGQQWRGGYAEIVSVLRGFSLRHERHRVFSDCMEMMACAMSNAVDLAHRDEREARYLALAKKYTSDELADFARALAALTIELGAGLDDVLGRVFSDLELHNQHAGQFFTPMDVARVTARLTLGNAADVKAIIEREGFVSLMEPAVGGGAMVIACAQALQDMGINYQQHMHVTAVDVDERVAHMAYVQFSLLHIPAIVVVGNSLSLDVRGVWYTPAHILGGWSQRRRNRIGGAA